MPGERPIIGRDDEGVFTPQQMKAMGSRGTDQETKALLQKLIEKPSTTEVALFDDRKSMDEYMSSREGQASVVRASRRHRREINA